MKFSNILLKSDLKFGFQPTFQYRGNKRFQTKTGGFFCLIHGITLLVYVGGLILAISENKTSDFVVTEQIIHSDEVMTNDTEKYMQFTPNNSTGWNMAFGFELHERDTDMTEDIGKWTVIYNSFNIPYTDDQSGQVKYDKYTEEYLPVRPCRLNEFNLTNSREKDKMEFMKKNLKCSDAF